MVASRSGADCESSSREFSRNLEILIRARYPLLGIRTWEEERGQKLVTRVGKKLGKRVYGWSASTGLMSLDRGAGAKAVDTRTADPQTVLRRLAELVDPSIFILFDFHHYMRDAQIIRALREVATTFRNGLKTLILMSPSLEIPMDLEKEIMLIDLPLPGMDDLSEMLESVINEVNGRGDIKIELNGEDRDKLVQSAMGLTLREAENVLARAIVTNGCLDLKALSLVISEKEQIIRKSGVLEFYAAFEDFGDIGGLDYLKDWLRKRKKSFSRQAQEFGLPAPKGIMLIGVQGCGKSLTAKAIAADWGMPLLKLDTGALFSSLVGSTEENLRRALATAEIVAPAVLWIDEIEKGFAGVQSSASLDAGVSARVFGGLVTWLQEKTSPVFVIATANDISQLPPEMLRKGRFDEIFFVDLPTGKERRQIFKIHLERRHFDPELFDVTKLVEESVGFSGAEIESCIISAMFDVFDAEGQLDDQSILNAISDTIPLSRLMTEKVKELKAWATGRVRKSSIAE